MFLNDFLHSDRGPPSRRGPSRNSMQHTPPPMDSPPPIFDGPRGPSPHHFGDRFTPSPPFGPPPFGPDMGPPPPFEMRGPSPRFRGPPPPMDDPHFGGPPPFHDGMVIASYLLLFHYHVCL